MKILWNAQPRVDLKSNIFPVSIGFQFVVKRGLLDGIASLRIQDIQS